MYNLPNATNGQRRRGFALALAFAGVLIAASAPFSRATELGGSVYPAGVDTVLPGLAPPPGSTLFLEFSSAYLANGLADSKGKSVVPGFQLSAEALAVRVVHTWNVQLLGGTLVSAAAAPLVHATLTVPGATGRGTGISNIALEPVLLAYAQGPLHWWYGVDIYTPGLSYTPSALINIGQHNFAYAPVAAFTYLPQHGRVELSWKYQYIINGGNSATHYKSGSEFIWEYDGMQQVSKNLYLGANGFWYQQVTGDRLNGLIFDHGHRGRDFAIGPQIKYRMGRCALAAKYQRDTLVQNRPMGDAFWVEFAMLFGRPRG